MKNMKAIALGLATLVWAGASFGQQTTTTTYTSPSIRDNPGTLGHSFGEIGYTWHHIKNNADAYDIGGMANIPVGTGFDAQLGYDYFWWNDSTDPTTVQNYDYRLHTLAAGGRFFGFNTGNSVKPFLGGMVGYAWSRGDFSRLRTFGHRWLFEVKGGAEIPLGGVTLTPHIAFADTMHRSSIGGWSYGAEGHAWFSEKLGGFVDATWHNPQHNVSGSYWTYTGGLRLRW
jgi:hypothetical protein